MIRLRKTDGSLVPIPGDVRFIEITDLEGRIGQLLVLKESGAVDIASASDVTFAAKYSKTFKVQFCPLISVPKSHIENYQKT
jgi:hypothetical protein